MSRQGEDFGAVSTSSEPISERKKIYDVCMINNMINSHPDITSEEKRAIIELLQSDTSMLNRIGISERLPDESRVGHAIRTLRDNRKLKKVLLTTAVQLVKTGDLVYDWSKLNFVDRISRSAKLLGGYSVWLGQVADATTYTIGYKP